MRKLKNIFTVALIISLGLFFQGQGGVMDKVKGAVSDAKGEFWLDLANTQYIDGNYASALGNYQKAANYELAEAYHKLYVLYSQGLGVSKDLKLSQEMLRKASDLGYPRAQTELATHILYTSKNSKEQKEAINLLTQAAKNEDVLACISLYNMYSIGGLYVKKDMAKANEYARLANALGADIDVPSSSTSLSNKDLLRQIQANLKILGFYSGSIDGLSGPMTRKAITDFQKSQGIKQTGEPSKELLNQTQKALR